MKAIVESFEGSDNLVTQTKVSLPTTGSATQLLKIKNQYKRRVKQIETMESAKYTIKEAVQAIQEQNFIKALATLTATFKNRIQNNNISKIMNMERPDISPAVYSLLQHPHPQLFQ